MIEFMNILGLFGFIMVIIIVVYTYKKYNKKYKFIPNNEYPSSSKKGELLLFHVSWCPYSKDTLTKWTAYKTEYLNTQTDGNISFDEIDCDENPALAQSYNIDEYPTIIMIVNNKKYIYDAKFSRESFNQFIKTVLK